jgi:mono/diheme cytochrome c family protein
MNIIRIMLAVVGASLAGLAAAEPSAERGKQALTTRAFVAAPWALTAYDNAWKHWDPPLKEKPADYDRAFREHYGLHPAPYENGRLPMGLREGRFLIAKGITSDCMMCHAGAIFGQSYIGLGNSSLDIEAIFYELSRASGGSGRLPFTFGRVRGTSEAGAMAVYLHGYREPDLKVRLQWTNMGLDDNLCEDTPAWWLLKKKQTMYHTGTIDARSVRSIMQFMLTPDNPRAVFEKEEATFADIRAYILSLEAPKYPLPIDRDEAAVGEKLFNQHCAKCHGTYGPKWTYPNKIVTMDVIGTDPNRFRGLSRAFGEHYNKGWFAQETKGGYLATEPKGYQAPPLDGVWATAPYFHNGSVPTLHDVLNSTGRPTVFTRSYATGREDFDEAKVGWKVQVRERGATRTMTPWERRRIYDTTAPGRSNAGHRFGDMLSADERRAVIEYLKTL